MRGVSALKDKERQVGIGYLSDAKRVLRAASVRAGGGVESGREVTVLHLCFCFQLLHVLNLGGVFA